MADRERQPADDKPDQDEPLGMDERVSFYPLEPDEVLRRLLQVPPVHRRGEHEPPEDGPTES